LKFNIVLILIVGLSLTTASYAEEMQYPSVTKMAEDTDCRTVCHSEDIHVIHEPTSATCQGCHGQTLSDRNPACIKCHTGTIHNVHIKKVQTENCSYCHAGLDELHVQLISDTLCVHCHKDLLNVHGGPTKSCSKCHGTAPNIVAPLKAEGNVIVCENCHISADVAALHGEATNISSCYRCHRPGSAEMNESEIPHFIHVPKVECSLCHLDQASGKIIIPECIMCHSVETLHGYNQIALKTSSTGLDCSVCHPMMENSNQTEAGISATVTEHAGEPTGEEKTGGNEETKSPGFGILLTFSALSVIYMIRKIK
jgi:hypothetical protein